MPSHFTSSLLFALSMQPLGGLAHYAVDSSFKIDVHSHVVPDIYRTALIKAGYPVKDGTLFVDGFPVPAWDLESHITAMDTQGVNYSTISITAPGVSFLADNPRKASLLARRLNDAMYLYTKRYTKRLGAMCLLPLPDIAASLKEIKYCLDVLKFDGVGLYSNANGVYLGNPILNPIFSLLNKRGATVFAHPASSRCKDVSLGYPEPMSEYPFESIRAMENLLLTGQRANHSAINIIFPHGGGAMPYLAARIAGIASLSGLGNLTFVDSLNQFKGYFFDTASATTVIQLGAMNAFGGVEKIITGTDFPYVPLAQSIPGLVSIKANGNYTDAQIALINNQNALGIFPGVAKKLGFAISN